MLIEWNPQTVHWFQTASEYTGFHENLSKVILPYVPEAASVVDLGCGAALMDIALAKHVKSITCVDQNEEVLRLLDEMLASRGLSHVQTLHADAADVRGAWDIVLMLFFGRMGDTVERYLKLCRVNLIAVVHAQAQGKLGPKSYHPPKCNTVLQTCKALEAKGVRYRLLEETLEYGQPFETREEAASFVRAYAKNPPDVVVGDYLDANLKLTGEAKYPYYLPNQKEFGVFIIGREENAHL